MKNNTKVLFIIRIAITIVVFFAYSAHVVIGFLLCYNSMLHPVVLGGVKAYLGLLAPLFVATAFLCVNLFLKHHIKISIVANIIIILLGVLFEVYPNIIGIEYFSLYSVSDSYAYPVVFDDASAYYDGVIDVLPDVSNEDDSVNYLYLSRFGYQTNIYLEISDNEKLFNSVMKMTEDSEPVEEDEINKMYDITIENAGEWTEYVVVNETEKTLTYFITRDAIVFNNKLTSEFDCSDMIYHYFYQ